MNLLGELINGPDQLQRLAGLRGGGARRQFYESSSQAGRVAVGAEPDHPRAGSAAGPAFAGAHHAQRFADGRRRTPAAHGGAPLRRDRIGAGHAQRAARQACRHHPHQRRRACGADGAATGDSPFAAAVSRHQRGSGGGQRHDRHRRQPFRRRRAPRRAGRQGHDRGAHQRRLSHGHRCRARLFQQPPQAFHAAGADPAQLHQHAPAHAWRPVRVGIRERRQGNQCAGGRPAGLQQPGRAPAGGLGGLGLACIRQTWPRPMWRPAPCCACWRTGARRMPATSCTTRAGAIRRRRLR